MFCNKTNSYKTEDIHHRALKLFAMQWKASDEVSIYSITPVHYKLQFINIIKNLAKKLKIYWVF